tara:strand:+ start:257 stop:610 length:354 start_codon:yes stop_codon:yes gene_type:complete
LSEESNQKVNEQGIVSSGDINKDYTVIGIVGTNVSDQKSVETKAGCMGGNATANVSVGTEAMYEKGANELFSLSKNKGGDAVIFANFEYRIALSGSGETAKQVQELFCYGTAVKFTS